MTESRLDPLGNVKGFYRGNIGKYGKPIPHFAIRVNEVEGYAKEKYVSHIDRIEDSYSIPFTKENVDKLQKYTDGKTSYSIEKSVYRAGITISVESFEAWRDGNSTELLRFGHIASTYEQQVLADEKIGKFIDHTTPTAGRVYR